MTLNSEAHPENPIHSAQQYSSLGKGEFIPDCIRYYSKNFNLTGSSFYSLDQPELEDVRRFMRWAPAYLQDKLFYTPFCEKEGLMTEKTESTLVGEMKVRTPKRSFDQRTSAELARDIKWTEFMATYILPRETLLKAVKEVILNIPVTHEARYSPDNDVRLFDWSMRVGGYRIAFALIPTLIDQEVRGLFGPQTSLAEIQKQIATQ